MSSQEEIEKALPAEIIMFSGCMDSQTSADVSNVASFNVPAPEGPTGAGGACTHALLQNVYSQGDDLTWIELLKKMQHTLRTKGYTQIPQLSSSKPLDLKDKFDFIAEDSGSRKSLFIGINYIGQQGELRGCHNDVYGMQKLLDKFGFRRDASQKVIMDDGKHEQPTRANIERGFAWLVAGAKAGDNLFMHYSGHGGSMPDRSGDESDHKDETLVPVDYASAGQIPDDDIFKQLCMQLPAGVHLTVLMDCCHSGSILDLPYAFEASEGNLHNLPVGGPMIMPQNPGFNLGYLLRLGAGLLLAYKTGGMGAAAAAGARALAPSLGNGTRGFETKADGAYVDLDGDGKAETKIPCCTVL